MIRIGHRGAMGHAPENTLASIRLAWVLGADMVEVDVRTCRSGEPVLIHDETIDRTTDGRGAVRDLTFEEIRRFDAGDGETVPSLAEALELVAPLRRINIELKDAGAATAAVTILADRPAAGTGAPSLLVSSFDLGILRDFHRLRPDLPVGALVEGDLEPVLRLAEEIPLFSVHMRPETLTRPLLERLSGRGLAVVVFTVNDPRELWRLKAWGVAGIISDYPDRLI